MLDNPQLEKLAGTRKREEEGKNRETRRGLSFCVRWQSVVCPVDEENYTVPKIRQIRSTPEDR